jgi:hypothetical protein
LLKPYTWLLLYFYSVNLSTYFYRGSEKRGENKRRRYDVKYD